MVEVHPFAEVFPLLDDEALAELAADIRQNGQQFPIITCRGVIIDGRNRLKACEMAGVEPVFWIQDELTDSEITSIIISANLHRRHLTTMQRAHIGAELANGTWGGDRSKTSFEVLKPPTIKEAAAALKVSKASVDRAVQVKRADPEAHQAAMRGDKEILKRAKEIRSEMAAVKRAARIEKCVELSNRNAPLPRDRKYPVIYADPPWRFETHSEETGRDRAADNHYPPMTTADICALPVADLATPDAVLFLWATAPMLPQALEVMDAWGFSYRSQMVWVKDKIGMGYYVRNRHELLLIAGRGNLPIPAEDARPDSVIEAPRTQHSAKPMEVYGIIDRMYPELPKIELFARVAYEGWDTWGNQAIQEAA
jgi:ParB/RepB/Spo0J family partition protein